MKLWQEMMPAGR